MEIRPQGAETILIVDDDELVRASAATLIGSLGYRVLSAGSGPEALEVLRQDTPVDLMFTDVFMPGGMHGPQLVAAARRLRPDLKVLFGSGRFPWLQPVPCRVVLLAKFLTHEPSRAASSHALLPSWVAKW